MAFSPSPSGSWRRRTFLTGLGLGFGCTRGGGPEAITHPARASGSHRAKLGEATLAYHVHGRGPPALVIPGGPGIAWNYLRLPPVVEAALELVYVEPLGTGGSDRLADPSRYSRSRDVADLEALRNHLGLERVHLIGHSHGGFVALDYALRRPERVAGLVLYDTAATNGPEFWAEVHRNVERYRDRRWYADATDALRAYETSTTDAELGARLRRFAPLYFHDFDARRDELAGFLASMRVSVDRALHGTPEPFDFRDRLAGLRVPTLVLVGASDFVCSPAMAEMIHRGIAGSRLVVFDRSGHFPHVEEPEAFARAVAEFVT